MSWKDDKDLGSWEFSEQPNKWGYLNNPKWSEKTDAQEFSEAVGNPIDPANTHVPCGHWHKNPSVDIITITYDTLTGVDWWQPSIDVLDGVIGLIPTNSDFGYDDEEQVGFAGLVYDVDTGVWRSRGIIYGEAPVYAEPNTCRLADDYMAFYGLMYVVDGDFYTYRLYVFKPDSDPASTDVFVEGTGTGEYEFSAYHFQNVMDCSGDRIACATFKYSKSGVDDKVWTIKVSYDQGVTFTTEWDFPARTSSADDVKIRMTEDGIVWALYLRGGTKHIELWKSNAGATSWTKIWDKDYSADTNGNSGWYAAFDVSDNDGQYISVFLEAGSAGGVYYNVFYTSSDYGSLFTTQTEWTTTHDLRNYIELIFYAKGAISVIQARRISDSEDLLIRSTDSCANFSDLVDPYDIQGDWPDMQGHDGEVVYVECHTSFSGDDYQGLLYSDDYGATWVAISSPAPMNTEIESEVIGNDVITTIDEPVVWPMD